LRNERKRKVKKEGLKDERKKLKRRKNEEK
jgi:hypothetical protein